MPFPRARQAWNLDPDVRVFVLEVVKSLTTLGMVALTVPKYVTEASYLAASVAGGGGAVICAVSVVTALTAWQQKRAKGSTHELEGCLETLHAVLQAAGGDTEDTTDPGIRITIHVPVKVGRKKNSETKLEQIANYVTNEASRATGRERRFSIHCGIIGKVYREDPPQTAIVTRTGSDYQEFLQMMVNVYNFTSEQAKTLDATVMSYMAVPLQLKGEGVAAIVYVDSRRRSFFTKARQELVEGACLGIALFVGRRYN